MKLNTVKCGDSSNVLKTFEKDSIDLTVTSPPYDNLRDYDKHCKPFTMNMFKMISEQLYRITVPGGVVVWVVGDGTVKGGKTGTSFRHALYFMDLGFLLYDTMIYKKHMFPYPSVKRYYNVFEYMFIFSKGKPKTIHLLKDRKNIWKAEGYRHSSIRKKDGTIIPRTIKQNKEWGVRFNIWEYNTGFSFSTSDKIAKQHPAIFPEKLAEDHIKSWSNERDIILDPFCGSGTTLVMAKCLNRNFYGIDISEKYVKIARERLKRKPVVNDNYLINGKNIKDKSILDEWI